MQQINNIFHIKNNKKRMNTFFFSIAIIFSLLITNNYLNKNSIVKAEDTWPAGIDVVSDSAIVMDVDTGTVLYAKNEHAEHYPASITKIMTALLAIENGNIADTVTYSEEAVFNIDRGSSSIARDVGEQMSLEQCLYAMMLESCNSSAYAIAEHVGGTYDNFIKMMNDKATELGCQNTHFNNPNGLPDENHYTSCYDMALISREAFKQETFRTITGTRTYTIPPTNKHEESTYLNNHHEMLHFYKTSKYLYDYCVGGKTGYTTQANSTLVTYAVKDGMTLVCVVMNTQSPNQYLDTTNLFNYCFDNFQVLSVKKNAPLYENTEDFNLGALSSDDENIEISDEGTVIIPKAVTFPELSYKILPAKKDEKASGSEDSVVIGTIEYSYAGRTVGQAEITALKDIDDSTDYPFHDSTSGELNDGKYERIDLRIIFLTILLIVAVIAFIVIWIKGRNEMDVKPVKNRKRRKSAIKPNFFSGKRIKKKRRRRKPKKNAYAHDLTSTNTKSDSYIKIKKH